MADTHTPPVALVFDRPRVPTPGPVALVFGETGGDTPAPGIPDATLASSARVTGLRARVAVRVGALLGAAGQVSGLRLRVAIRTGAVLGGTGQVSGLRVQVALQSGAVANSSARITRLQATASAPGAASFEWDANVSRGGIRAELASTWQQAAPLAAGAHLPWQQAESIRVAAQGAWQSAQPLAVLASTPWQQAQALRNASAQHWQPGDLRRAAIDAAWQQAQALRAANLTHWQQGELRRCAIDTAWQDTLRLRAAARSHWQDGASVRAWMRTRYGHATATRITLRPRWQEGIRPGAGRYQVTPPGPRQPCYVPALPAHLVFDLPRDSSLPAHLVFVCEGHNGPVIPPALVVVPAQRTYIMINSVEIRRADSLSGDPLPSESFSMQLNRQSWTWSFSAAFHAAAREAVSPGLGGEPVELEVRVNGQPFRMQSERVGRSKRFPEHMVAVSGRGRAAVLDDPRVPAQTFTHALDRTAQQLMTDVLTINGVGFGWSVDFGLQDWLVPGGVWMHRGSWSSALADIAASVGGYLQPHDTDPVIRVLPLWPKPWWEWDTLAPDIELPAGIGEVEDTEVIDLPLYDRILVSGEARGVALDWTRANTAGLVLKDMALHPLITTIEAARQRGIAELSESGRMLKHKLTMPVLPQTGVIKPGTVLRYADDDAAQRIGIVRATSVSEQWPVLTQSLEIDGHA